MNSAYMLLSVLVNMDFHLRMNLLSLVHSQILLVHMLIDLLNTFQVQHIHLQVRLVTHTTIQETSLPQPLT